MKARLAIWLRLAVGCIILLISNINNFSDIYTTVLLIFIIMLFQMMSKMSSITAGEKAFLGHGCMHRVYESVLLPFIIIFVCNLGSI
jgi:hypothetical protein